MFYIQERVKNCFLFSTCVLNAFMVKVYNARNVFLRHFVMPLLSAGYSVKRRSMVIK